MKLDKEIFDSLLYISRLDIDESQKQTYMEQIQKVVDDMEVLRTFVSSETTSEHTDSELDLRGNSIGKNLNTQALKQNSSDYVDGYFRVPKVLGES